MDEATHLEDLATQCKGLWKAWEAVIAQQSASARPGSPAEEDANSFRDAHPKAFRNVERTPSQFAALYLSAVGQHHRAFTALLEAGAVTLVTWTAVRAELEHAGRIAWMLQPAGGEASLSAEDRVARALMEQLAAFCRARFTAGKMKRRQAVKDLKVFRERCRAIIGDVFPGSMTDWCNHWNSKAIRSTSRLILRSMHPAPIRPRRE